MILGKEELQRIEQLKRSEELLFKALFYIDEVKMINGGYDEAINFYRNNLEMTEEELDYYGLIDYDMEKERIDYDIKNEESD